MVPRKNHNSSINSDIWDLDNLLDDNITEDGVIYNEDKYNAVEDILDDSGGDEIPVVSSDIVDTRLLRVNLDIVNHSKSRQVNLHQLVIASIDSSLFNGSKRYNETDLGKIVRQEIREDVAPSSDMIILNNGESLAERIKKKHYNSNRFKLKEIIEKAGEELNINIYKTNSEVKKINLDVIEKKSKEETKVYAGDNKAFIDKHRKKTKYEKSILKTLGITEEALKKLVSPKSILSIEEKAKLLSVASSIDEKKGHRQTKKGPKIAYKDLEILFFLDLCRYASLRNLYYADGMKSIGSVGYRLKRLEKMGIVRNVIVYGSPGVYSLTTLGRSLIGSERPELSKKQANPSSLAERIYVNHVQACLFSGCLDILQDGVKYNRVDSLGNRILGEEIVPETDLTKSMGRKSYELKGNIFVKDSYPGETMSLLRENWEIEWRKWENSGRGKNGPELDSPWLYILFYEDGIRSRHIIPDIVVKRDRGEDGRPNSIAIEVERSLKSEDEYVVKLSAYKRDDRVYSKVIYITPSKTIAERISRAAERIGFTDYDIVPMVDENGFVPESKSHWLL